jgi:SAM-dependent methyltransferase
MFPDERVHRLLKADLFDEAFGGGLQSLLDLKARVVVGMDIALNTVELARSKYPEIITLNTDALQLPFRDASFSVIVSNSTLDHFPSRRFILSGLHEFFRILQPGGILLLTMDNLLNPFVVIRQWISFPVLRRLGIVPYYFGKTFGPARLKAALRDCGFTFSKITPFMHCPRLPAVALSRMLTKYGTATMQQRFLRLILLLEKISFYPICLASGHYLAVRAMKPVKPGFS